MDFHSNKVKGIGEFDSIKNQSKLLEESKVAPQTKDPVEILNERQKSIYVDTEPIKCKTCGTVAFVMIENGEYCNK